MPSSLVCQSWHQGVNQKIPTADHNATIMKESQCRGFQITGLFVFVCVYMHTCKYIIYIYTYVSCMYHIYIIYISYSYHIIFIYTSYPLYIYRTCVLWHPVPIKKKHLISTSNTFPKFFPAHHTRSSQAALVGESPVPNIWFPPREDGKHHFREGKTPWFPRKNRWKPESLP